MHKRGDSLSRLKLLSTRPKWLSNVHFKATIEMRIAWITNNMVRFVMHVVRKGATKCKKVAKRVGREIINLTYTHKMKETYVNGCVS